MRDLINTEKSYEFKLMCPKCKGTVFNILRHVELYDGNGDMIVCDVGKNQIKCINCGSKFSRIDELYANDNEDDYNENE